MLILDYPEWNQPTIAQVLIPEVAYKLTPELEKINKLLQDESYEYPIVDRFNFQREFTTKVLDELKDLNYSYNSMCQFRAAFKRIIKYADMLGITHFSEGIWQIIPI